MIHNLCWCQVVLVEATFLLGLLFLLPRIFASLTGTLPPSLPGVRPAAWPGPKPRFSSCFWGVLLHPSLLQYIYIYNLA